jgi:hypothetical protein
MGLGGIVSSIRNQVRRTGRQIDRERSRAGRSVNRQWNRSVEDVGGYQTIGAVVGTVAGAFIGGAPGAQAGYAVGGAVGGAADAYRANEQYEDDMNAMQAEEDKRKRAVAEQRRLAEQAALQKEQDRITYGRRGTILGGIGNQGGGQVKTLLGA